MGLFKKDDNHSPFSGAPDFQAKKSQSFAKRLLALLSGKRVNTWKGDESHWELIIGFCFFFGGLYFLFSFLGGL